MDEHLDYRAYPILYIDDEPFALETLQRQFKKEFTILTAPSAPKGLEMLQEREVALVLADQRMPEMMGTRFLARVRQHHPDTVRMLLTAYTDLGDVIDAINLGHVYRYLTKPYDEQDVRIAFREGIKHYALVKERNRLYAANVETMKRVARANRLSAVGTMAAGLAHEINNPLVPISTFLQMLPAKRDEPVRDEEYWGALYEMTLKEVERIRGLIQKLLTYAKFTGETQPEFKPVEIHALLQDIATLLASQARARRVQIALHADPALPALWVDAERIKQVFLNLLLNAIQAMPNGGTATVTTRGTTVRGAAHAEIEVADTGSGIPSADLDKLFTPFFTTKGNDGNGLGLLTCHHVIDEHRGTIDVRSAMGQGTTFIVRLPLDPRTFERRHRRGDWWDDTSLAAAA